MPNTESGYAKNAANLKDLIIRLKTLEKAYQPPKSTLQLKELESLSKKAEEATRAVSQALPVYRKAVDEQELVFKQLGQLITKSFNYLKAATQNPAELQNAKTLADKLRGIGKKKVDTEGKTASSKSSASYDSQIENYKQYIDVLINSKVYQPAETAISIKTMQTLLSSMENNITAVAIAKTPVDDARKKRLILFHAEQSGLIDTVLSVKNYIKASLNQDHPQRKYILGLTFTRIKI